jgi:hypothetical protein
MYVYGTCIRVESFPRCVRRVIFCHYILPVIKNVAKIFRFILRSLTKIRPSHCVYSTCILRPKNKSTCSMLHFQFHKINFFKFANFVAKL